METSLHTQKVAILSRLIKESSLTLEEALLLLKEENVQESVQDPVQQPLWNPGTTTPWIGHYTGNGNYPLAGSGTITLSNNGLANITSNTTAFPPSSTYTKAADLNN